MSNVVESSTPVQSIPAGDKYVVGISSFKFKDKQKRDRFAVHLYIATGIPDPGVGVSVDRVTIFDAVPEEFYLGKIRTVLYEPSYRGNFRCTGVIYFE